MSDNRFGRIYHGYDQRKAERQQKEHERAKAAADKKTGARELLMRTFEAEFFAVYGRTPKIEYHTGYYHVNGVRRTELSIQKWIARLQAKQHEAEIEV